MFYSPSTGGFYAPDLLDLYRENGTLPDDIVEIEVAVWRELVAGQASGKRVVAGADGLPELADPVAPTLADLIAAAKEQVRAARRPVFYALAGMQSESLSTGDSATAKAIAEIQRALRELTDIDLSACKTAEDIKTAFTTAWRQIAAQAPASVVSAFGDIGS